VQPDVIILRSDRTVPANMKTKISLLCDVPEEAVISNVDAPNLYEIPLSLHDEGLDDYVCQLLRLDVAPEGEGAHPVRLDLSHWQSLVRSVESANKPVRIGLIGKYVNLPDAYLSVVEALRHGGYAHGAKVQLDWVQAEEVEGLMAEGRLRDLDGMIVPGGFGERGIEGMIAAVGYARDGQIPCLGLCLGLQVMVIEFARNVAGLERANSREFSPSAPHLVIDLMDEQREIVSQSNYGGTMRLGTYPAKLRPGTQMAEIYGSPEMLIFERHRHRYEFNPRYRSRLEQAGLVCSGESPDGRLVEMIELPGHPLWIGTQAHPEFKSRPDRPHPLFKALVGAASERAEGRQPHLIDPDQLRGVPLAQRDATEEAGVALR
jgi:CTP synthase